MFRSFFFLFRRLISEVTCRSSNFATCSMVTQIYEILLEIWVPPPPVNLAAQKHEISARFRTTLRLDREFLRNTTGHRQSENGVANYGHSCTGKQVNFVYFGPQSAKYRTGVMAHQLAIVQRTGVNKSVAFARWRH